MSANSQKRTSDTRFDDTRKDLKLSEIDFS